MTIRFDDRHFRVLVILSIISLFRSDAIKRPHPPDEPHAAKRLKTDTSSGYLPPSCPLFSL